MYALAFDDERRLFASVKTFGVVQSGNLGKSWRIFESVDLTVTSIATDSQNKEIYIAGFSSGGFQEVYKIKYDSSSYELIGTNKGLR